MDKLFKKRIDIYIYQISKLKRRDMLLSLARLMLFLLFVVFISIYFTNVARFVFLIVGLIGLIGFAVVFKQNTAVKRKLTMLQTKLQINENELEFLKGNKSIFEDGKKYMKIEHSFAYDLDVFGKCSLFQAINRSALAEGSDELATWLNIPLLDKSIIQERQRAATELKDDVDWRQHFQALGIIEQLPLKHFPSSLSKSIHFKPGIVQKILIYLSIALLFTGIVFASLGVVSFSVPIFWFVLQLMAVAFFARRLQMAELGIDKLSKQFGAYYELIGVINDREFNTTCLNDIKMELFGVKANALEAFRELKKILGVFEMRTNMLYHFFGNGFFMMDIHLLARASRWNKKYKDYLSGWVNSIAKMNAINSLANFAHVNPVFTMPEFSDNDILDGKEVGHPLIDMERNVRNHFTVSRLNQIFVITGANMAGKSTFLRAVGLNMVLACVGAPVCADRFLFQPVKLFTSMRTTDDLSRDLSYFHAELVRLKQLKEFVSNKENVEYLVILDEILKGTNSQDKMTGSRMFLQKLLQYPLSALIATHDLSLSDLEKQYPENIQNLCFEIEIENDDVKFDYKLRKGVTSTMNATFLLKKMGLLD